SIIIYCSVHIHALMRLIVIKLNIGSRSRRLNSQSETQIAISRNKKPAIKAGSCAATISEY
ncbi:hypothetical protein CKF43_20325, partial [Pantoea graminicola]|uniref:hypothetical protein n=1 Tax=Pantoea sp. ARC607 TaxID=2027922 RepID=UPI000DB3C25F